MNQDSQTCSSPSPLPNSYYTPIYNLKFAFQPTMLQQSFCMESSPSLPVTTQVLELAKNSFEVAAKEMKEMKEAKLVEECTRERLKKHRMEMAGRVWIPEMWGQENLLKDWIDCTAFDSCLFPKGLLPAREALVKDCRRRNPSPMRIRNHC